MNFIPTVLYLLFYLVDYIITFFSTIICCNHTAVITKRAFSTCNLQFANKLHFLPCVNFLCRSNFHYPTPRHFIMYYCFYIGMYIACKLGGAKDSLYWGPQGRFSMFYCPQVCSFDVQSGRNRWYVLASFHLFLPYLQN